MKAPLFNEILKISQDLADASAKDDEKSRTEHYQALIKLCANNEDSPKDHPLQWEALADFTNDSDQALDIYQKGLVSAEKLKLPNFIASIYLAMAERHHEMAEQDQALAFANKANDLSESITSDDLKNDISELLQQLNQANT
mgnify:CR=1 FL=1